MKLSGHIKNLEGQKFGRLLVWEYAGIGKNKATQWLCKCECGKEITVRSQSLTRGNTRSCGCLRVEELRNNPHHKTKHDDVIDRLK